VDEVDEVDEVGEVGDKAANPLQAKQMLAGLILAGGKSSRMGIDKSLLTMPNSSQTLLEYCKKKLELACGDNIFVSGSQHHQGIADVIPHCGPLSGIHAAITHLQMNYPNINELLVTAVDMPDLCHEDFEYLLNRGRNSRGLCCFENCFFPLYIPLSSKVTEYLTMQLKQQPDTAVTQPKKQQYSVKVMLNILQGLQIQPLKNTQLNNINTLVQWDQRCAKQLFIKAKNDNQ
jgi:molybdopterin-guanine dinucleotide biosynthesis protein A